MPVNLKDLDHRSKNKLNEELNTKSIPILFNLVMNKDTYEKAEKVFFDWGMYNFFAFVIFMQETKEKGDLLFKLPKREILGDDTVSFTFDMSIGNKHFKPLKKICDKNNTNLEELFYALYQETARLGEFPFELPYADISEEELAYINSPDE